MLNTTPMFVDAAPRRVAAFTWAEGLVTALPADYHGLGLGGLYETGRFRGGFFVPFGVGNDNDTFNYRLWLVRRLAAGKARKDLVDEYLFRLLGYGTATLSATTGSAGKVIDDTMRIADTLTWTLATDATTPKGAGEKILAALTTGTIDAYSPADGTPAELCVPDLGAGYEVAFEIQSAGTTGGFLAALHV